MAVILTLALAMGANTAIFSVVNAVLLRPLPYPDPGRLLCVWHGDGESYSWYTFSFPRFVYFQQNLKDIADVAAYDDEVVTLWDHSEPVRVEGGRVSANFFSVLGVQPQIGRGFKLSDDRHGAAAVLVLSDRIWRQKFKADPAVVGRSVVIDGEDAAIIGVMPTDFHLPTPRWISGAAAWWTRAPSPQSMSKWARLISPLLRVCVRAFPCRNFRPG